MGNSDATAGRGVVEAEFGAVTFEEFVGEASDTASTLDVLIGNMRSGAADPVAGMNRMRREIQELSLRGRMAHAPLVELLVGRMMNYVSSIARPERTHLDDLDAYLDVLRGILEGDIGMPSDEAEFVRSLPARRPLDVSEILQRKTELLLVEPQRTTARFVERELLSNGFRVCLMVRAFDALEQAVRTKPDLIIAAATLDVISGADLGRALKAIESTRALNFALLTSFERTDSALADLPPATAVLRKGRSFTADLTDALKAFGMN